MTFLRLRVDLFWEEPLILSVSHPDWRNTQNSSLTQRRKSARRGDFSYGFPVETLHISDRHPWKKLKKRKSADPKTDGAPNAPANRERFAKANLGLSDQWHLVVWIEHHAKANIFTYQWLTSEIHNHSKHIRNCIALAWKLETGTT